MAILWEDDFEGTPTSGTPSTLDHPWAYDITGDIFYTSATVAGLRSVSAGPAFAAFWVDLTSRSVGRLRWIGQWSGTLIAHHALTRLRDASNTHLADAQIRNISGFPVLNRWNFSSAGQTTEWPQNTPWRFEYRWDATGTLLEVWTDPSSTGEPDWAIATSGTATLHHLQFGNAIQTTGGTHLIAAASMSEGERIGPYNSVVVPEPVVDLSGLAGNGQVALSWTAPTDGGAPITDYVVQTRSIS